MAEEIEGLIKSMTERCFVLGTNDVMVKGQLTSL